MASGNSISPNIPVTISTVSQLVSEGKKHAFTPRYYAIQHGSQLETRFVKGYIGYDYNRYGKKNSWCIATYHAANQIDCAIFTEMFTHFIRYDSTTDEITVNHEYMNSDSLIKTVEFTFPYDVSASGNVDLTVFDSLQYGNPAYFLDTRYYRPIVLQAHSGSVNCSVVFANPDYPMVETQLNFYEADETHKMMNIQNLKTTDQEGKTARLSVAFIRTSIADQ